MLPMTLQFLIGMIASAINDRLQRKLDHVEEERRILREPVVAPTGGKKLSFTAQQGCRLAEAGPVARQVVVRGAGFPSVTAANVPTMARVPPTPASCMIDAVLALILSALRALRSGFRPRADLVIENLALRQ
jgi:hypothetical protein